MTVLMTVGVDDKLAVPAGLAYNRARAAGAPAGITSSHRDPVYQAYLRAQWLAGVPGFNFALPPDQSTHCMGLAIDVPGKPNALNTPKGWFTKHGKKFGFYPVANEDWHFEYRATQDPSKPKKENDMPGRNWFDRTTDQAIAPGKWTTVQLNNKGDISVAIGNEVVSANVQVEVSGIPVGVNFQIRMYAVDVVGNKTTRSKTLNRTKVEAVGTVGVAAVQTSAVTGLANNQRLRAEVWVPADVTNAKIINAGADALTWN